MAEEKSFEVALKQLEGLVLELERAEQPLDAQLKAFEEGVRLSRHCLAQLDAADKQIAQLSADDSGQLKKKPFATEA